MGPKLLDERENCNVMGGLWNIVYHSHGQKVSVLARLAGRGVTLSVMWRWREVCRVASSLALQECSLVAFGSSTALPCDAPTKNEDEEGDKQRAGDGLDGDDSPCPRASRGESAIHDRRERGGTEVQVPEELPMPALVPSSASDVMA